MKRNDYIVIQAPMVTDLKLKGNRLIVYALIFGFCKDGEHEFKGSLNYICEWTNLTRNAVIDTLKSLINDGLIVKREYKTNNVKFCAYSLGGSEKNALLSKKDDKGSEKNALGGSEKNAPNNVLVYTNTNNIDKDIEKNIDNNISHFSSEKGLFDNDKTIVTMSTNNQTNEKENDAFVDKIYKMYPTKCPVRGVSLGKTHADKKRIKNLLKRYTQEQIEKVVESEVRNKHGKYSMKNFSTFLNNFPDPDGICDNTRPRNNEPVGFHLDEGVRERMREAKEDGSGEW